MAQPKPDLYIRIHKAIRVAMSDFLVALGSTDAADGEAWARIADQWRALDAFLESHSHHEDSHVHPMIRRAAPDVADALDAQHGTLERAIEGLRLGVTAVDRLTDSEARRARAYDVYVAYGAFMADYFRHLIEEETRAQPALLAAYSDDELLATHRALVASIPPDEFFATLPFMARGLDPRDRIGLMMGVRNAPPAVFDAACRIMREAIGDEAFVAVDAALRQTAA